MKYIKDLGEENINYIVDILNKDGVIIIPTDTVYGLACNAFSDKAIEKLFAFKKRDKDKPINVLTNSIDKIKKVTKDINDKEFELMTKYFPGDLTIILNKQEHISNLLTANLSTIGVRIPNNKIALKILEAYPNPLAVTSVNISGTSPGLEVNDFINEFKNVEIIVDGGRSKIGKPSTIIRVENNKIKVLRQGNLIVE
jgi:L-threonylcarbamoyladenylate synthase